MVRCGVCGEEDADFSAVTRYPGDGAQYYACPVCRAVFLFPLPAKESNLEFEGRETARRLSWADRERLEYFKIRLDWVNQGLPPGRSARRLLEVGCGSGVLLELARACGWNVAGVELSADLAEQARRLNPGVEIFECDVLEQPLPEGAYDAVLALDVLEHVLSPRDMLLRLHRALRPGGVILLQTPNAGSLRYRLHGERWNMLIPEYHFHLFASRSLRRLLQECGFDVLWIQTASGSGVEKGPAKLMAEAKERFLSTLSLGNALVALAKASG